VRILCVIDSLGSGGAQRQLVELATGFKEKGHDVVILTYNYFPFYNPIVEQAGVKIECLHEPNYFKRIFRIRWFIRKGKWDIVLSFLETPNFLCELAGLPFRTWKLVVGERSADPKILSCGKLKLFRWFHLLADYVVANSEANMVIVRAVNIFLSDAKCRVIYNIVDFNKWKPSLDYIPGRNKKLKIVVVSSHQYLKNLNGLLEALSLMSIEEHNKIAIEWYGDSISAPYVDHSIVEAFEKIDRYKLGNIISLKPATHDISGIIQVADAVALFSFHEGLPNSVCEGMACAKPIICSTVSDIPILLSHDANLLFNPEEPQNIKRALCYMINLSNAELMRIGLINEMIAKEKFNKEVVVTSYLQLFAK